jgi:hypothetical protein
MKNGNSGKIIHLSEDGISIGSENQSQQPAVVGNDNQTALEMLNDTIKDMSDLMQKHLNILSIAADSSPYTKHLKMPLTNHKNELKAKIDSLHADNDAFFPETKSTFITVDKT